MTEPPDNDTRALTVRCPTCKAAVGVPCTRRIYRHGWSYHLTRIDKAARREYRDQERRART
jgi:hypothetical protein